LTWTAGAEEALKKKHKLKKYTPKDFNDYKTFENDLDEKEESFQKIAPNCDPDQVKLISACFENLEKSKTRWLDGFDKHLPKELRKVGDFLKKAEKEVRKIEESENALKEEFEVEEVQKRIKGLNACSEFLREHVEHENVEKVQKWLSKTEELLQQSIVTLLDEIADYGSSAELEEKCARIASVLLETRTWITDLLRNM